MADHLIEPPCPTFRWSANSRVIHSAWGARRARSARSARGRGRRRRPRRRLGLPLLRRRLRPAGLRQGRAGHPDRGRPRQPDLPRAPVPEGLGHEAARHEPRPADEGPVPRARTPPSGRSSRSTQAMDMIADRVIARARGGLAGRDDAGRATSSAARSASRTSAAPRSTTRRTTSSRSCSPRSAPSRSRTRPAYDTRSTVPGLGTSFGRGGATTSSRTCRTPTAS